MLKELVKNLGEHIEVDVPLFPPKVDTRANAQLQHEYRVQWFDAMREALKGCDKQFDCVYVVITYYVKNFKSFRDLDNIEYKYIIDSLRYAKIIKDDNGQNVTLVLDMQHDPENPRTNILIVEQKPKLIKSPHKIT